VGAQHPYEIARLDETSSRVGIDEFVLELGFCVDRQIQLRHAFSLYSLSASGTCRIPPG